MLLIWFDLKLYSVLFTYSYQSVRQWIVRWIVQYNPEITVLKGLANVDLYWWELFLKGDHYHMIFTIFTKCTMYSHHCPNKVVFATCSCRVARFVYLINSNADIENVGSRERHNRGVQSKFEQENFMRSFMTTTTVRLRSRRNNASSEEKERKSEKENQAAYRRFVWALRVELPFGLDSSFALLILPRRGEWRVDVSCSRLSNEFAAHQQKTSCFLQLEAAWSMVQRSDAILVDADAFQSSLRSLSLLTKPRSWFTDSGRAVGEETEKEKKIKKKKDQSESKKREFSVVIIYEYEPAKEKTRTRLNPWKRSKGCSR